MKINTSYFEIYKKSFMPCGGFESVCKEMIWNPAIGHIPRGFTGGTANPDKIRFIFVFAEPGDPHEGEIHDSIESGIEYAYECFKNGKDQFHRNVRDFINLIFPKMSFDEQLEMIHFTESVLCSASVECGKVTRDVERECGRRYLKEIVGISPNASVIAFGGKSQARLKSQGIINFIPAPAMAPPGCNFPDSKNKIKKIIKDIQDMTYDKTLNTRI